MRYKRFVSRLEAGALAAVMAVTAGWLVPGAAAAETVGDGVTPVYDEAYYATLDYYGNLLEGSVVKSYALNGFDGLTDRGRYDSVVNLTDGTAPVTGQGRVSFRFGDAAPERFYFEGKTAQPFEDLPWTVTVRYTLNGVPARAEELGASLSHNRAIAEKADYIFLGVKPQMMGELLEEIGPVLAGRKDRFVLVTMASRGKRS